MFQKKRPEALKSSESSQNAINSQVTHAQAPDKGTRYDLPTRSCNEAGHSHTTGMPYHQVSSVKDGHESRNFAPISAAARLWRHCSADEESSSRAKMWDPVKDCSDPKTRQADIHSTASGFTSMGPHFPHKHRLYDQAQESQQQLANPQPRGAASMGLPLHYQSRDLDSGYRETAEMGLDPYPQSHAMASVCQVSNSIGSQRLHVGRRYDHFQHSRQDRTGYEDVSTLHPHLRDPSREYGQQPLCSGTQGAALTDMQPLQAGLLHDQVQEYGQQYTGMESRTPSSMAFHESTQFRQQLSSAIPKHSPQGRIFYQQVHHLQRQSFSAHMSQAMEVAQYAERLDQQSNHEEAMRAYEQACALFQDVIIRSCSLDERMECNAARNAYQARLDVLLRESAASLSSPSLGQNDEQDDDGPGGGKPQYSLYEDWALCRKVEEGLSWQEVAETSVFRGRRKHRSLSQRKHTIGKMGPRYHEPEEPWTEEENQKLCALGDAGKTLGDIHRKFRSRNAERCLDQYFHLKGYHTTGPSRTHKTHQARHDPAPFPRSIESTHYPSVVTRHPAYGIRPGTLLPTITSHDIHSVSTLRGHTPERPSLSSHFTGTRASKCSAASVFLNNVASIEPFETRTQGSSGFFKQQQRPGASTTCSTYPLASSRPEGPENPASSFPAEVPHLPAPGALSDNFMARSASLESLNNTSTERAFHSMHRRLTMSSSSLSATTANSPPNPTSSTSPLSSPRTVTTPFQSHDSPVSHGAAVTGGACKSRRGSRVEKL